jgi:histone H3/H4
MRQAKREGRWNGVPPTGYDRYKTGNIHTITPNAKAKYVEESFKLFSKGIYSKEEVRRKMREQGFKLTKNPFSRMLSNPVYTGKIVIKAWKEEKEEIVQGLHEAIVTESLFEKVQSILRSKRVQPLQKTTKDPNLPLCGFLSVEAI